MIGPVGRHAGSQRPAAVGREARGHVHRQHPGPGRAGRGHGGDGRRERPLRRPGEAGAEERVDHHVARPRTQRPRTLRGVADLDPGRGRLGPGGRGVAAQPLLRHQRDHPHRPARLAEQPRRHVAVAAVVATAAEHQAAPLRRRQEPRLRGHRRAGPLHQHERRDPQAVDGRPVDGPHLGRAHQPHAPPSATTTAAATPPSWVRVRCSRSIPSRPAACGRAAGQHQRRRPRGAADLGVGPAHAGRRPQRLGRGLLGREAGGVAAGPVGGAVAEGPLARGEDPGQEALRPRRRPVQDAGQPRDLHQVEPQAQDHDRACRSSSFISRTARSNPTMTARATMEWPMLSSSISGMAATGSTFW